MSVDPLYANRAPVSTYSDALSWLWQHSRPEEWFEEGDEMLPVEAKLVSDMFWISGDKLRKDMRKLWRSALGGSLPPVRSGRPYSGWR
ncbi:MAG: hypothetical protein Q4G22_05885 [Paracoccus sp. (in: a-proteobacteria)]|uniref:hypothetical protein n=1 Tax=Paracoccus sp. TaxID=267 RepID=UPI0026E0C6DF|nr:hypothetical protein [Paracoccus sp. (in: a-proteobacteria)]MDO5631354.1 hypothetical protein [Paracoccus sp. (in: a-proteobacteria)]